jgi:Fur family ferric uptake transcriptional regulator
MSDTSTAKRRTRQGDAVLAVLADGDTFRSAQELHTELRGAGERVGLTTVYRHLQALADAGEVDTLRTADGESLYRRCGKSHHHHLVCRVCGATKEVDGPEVEEWATRVARQSGFTKIDHTVEILGTCRSCSRRR